MKRFYNHLLFLAAVFLFSTQSQAQVSCTFADATTATRISPSAFPYTSPGSGITVAARLVSVGTFANFSYDCGGVTYACSPTAWGIGNASANDSIILTFSVPVKSFSFVVNGTDAAEIFTVTPQSGTVTLSNFCSSFGLVSGFTNKVQSSISSTGTMVTVTNSSLSNQYVITHNGAAAGSRISLLDCIIGYRGPADVNEGIQLWLDGSNVNNGSAPNPADTTKIAVWKDISGNNNNATVLAGQDTARMNTAQINGKDVMQFTGSSISNGSVYEVAGVDIRAASMPKTTIFTVYKQAPFTAGSLQGLWGNDNANWDRFFMSSFSGTTGIVSVGLPASYVAVPNAGNIGETKLLTAVYHNGVTDSSVIYFNGAPVSRITDNSSPTDAQTNLRIGWDGDNNPYTGDIAEMVVYNRKLTDCEIIAVNRYFGYKYGVTLSTAVISPSAPQYLCTGGSVLLTSNTGISYKWLKDGAIISASTASTYTASASGKYSVIIESGGGCFDTSAATSVFVGSRIYVDSSVAVSGTGSSWASPLKTVSEALNGANSMSCATEIWVKKGTYYPMAGNLIASSRDSAMHIYKNNIKIYGGFNGTETLLSARSVTTNPTILSGDIGVSGDSTDNSYHVLAIVATPSKQIDSSTIVDGFTITRGNANGSGSFTGNTIAFNQSDGGGIIIVGMTAGNKSNPLIENCTITRNSATFGGGLYNAAHNGGQSSPTIRNCSFINNHAFNQGAGFHSWGDGTNPILTAYFANCIFQANNSVSSGAGGSIRMNSSTGTATHVFTNCSFLNNNANSNNGGGINYESNSTAGPTFNSCTFTNNLATWGAGYYVTNTSGTTLSNCTFTGNKASYVGGAILSSNSNINIDHSNFSNNTATSFGGAICHPFSTARTLNINACNFTGSYSPNGGCIYSQDDVTINIDSSNFTGNKSTFGGVLLVSTTKFNMSNSTCSADTADYGSVIRNYGHDTSTIFNCKFLNNVATVQGGVENVGGAYLTIRKTAFFNNKAGNNGAAILSFNSSSITNLNNCVIANNSTSNTAVGGGGAIDIQQGNVYLNNTSLSNNTTASTVQPNANSIWIENSSTLTLNNSIVWGSAAQHIDAAGTATTSYNYSLVKGLSLTAPNLNTNPQFTNAADPDGADNIWGTSDDGLHMTPCSPAINAGNNTLVPAGMTTDFAAATRIQNTTVDMGAYEQAYGSTGLPDILIAASPSNIVCSGTTVSFPTTLVATGTSPTYKWYKNGTLVSTSATYSSSTLTSYDTVWAVLTNNDCSLSDTSNRVVITVVPSLLFVDSSVAVSQTGYSWASPVKTVSQALTIANAVSCPVEIWVKKGTYFPEANRDSSFRIFRNNIKIYGGFAGTETLLASRSVTANPTILSGDIGVSGDSTDNCYHVFTVFGSSTVQIDSNTIIDGFKITKGNAQFVGSFTFRGQTFNRQDGAGIYLYGIGSGNKCSPRISNCTITANAANFGGGVYSGGFSSGNASPVFLKNTFTFNKANSSGGGIFNNGQSSGTISTSIDSCIFSNNTAGNGGGLYNNAPSGTAVSTINNSQFTNNIATSNGGAMYNNYALITTLNSLFSKNSSAGSGGAIFQEGSKNIFIKNVFDQNASPIGGAMRIYNGTPSIVITNNIFFKNTSSINDGGALSLVMASGIDTVINNLFVQNKNTGSGPNGGGAMVQEGAVSSYIVNNTFYADTSTSSGGAVHFKDGGSNRTLINNIFYKSYNGSAATDYNTASGASVTTESNNLYSTTNPRFVNELNPIGADGIWLTADDGLELIPCSPAVNTATTAPATDIRNRSRLGLPDIGAYEEQTGILPVAPTVTTPVIYCQNATASALTATKTSATDTLKWYNASSTLLSGAPTPLTTTAGTFTYFVSQINITGCESVKATITVTINPAGATPTVTTPVVYCQGVTATALTATKALTSDTLRWYNAALTLLPGAPTPSTTTVGSTDYFVSAKTNFNCEGSKAKITVVVNPTPALPTSTSPIVYCQGFPAVPLTATASTSSDTLRWYDATPTLLSGAPTPSTVTAGSFTFYVSQKNSFACESAKRTITVNVNPTPLAPAAPSPVTYCQEDIAVALTATKASPTDTLKWYNSSMLAIAGTPIPSTVTAGTTIYYVSDKTALGCEGPKTMVTVQVNPKPVAPTVVTPINLCVGIATTPLTATGINLKWYTVATGGTSTPSVTPPVTAVGTQIYYVTQTTLLGCESSRTALTVNIQPSPVVTIATISAPAFVFCVGDSIALKATSATAISYQWTRNTITMPGSTKDTLSIKTTANYAVIVKDNFGCADTEAVFVMENPLPVPKLSPVDVSICDGVTIMLYGSPGGATYKYEWFKDGIYMGVDTTKSTLPVSTTGLYTIKITDKYKCVITTNGSNVSKYPTMVKPTIVRTGTVLKLTVFYATYQWYRTGKAIAGANSSTYTMSFDGTYHVVVTDLNGCEGTSETLESNALNINLSHSNLKEVRLYPNPTQGNVIIDADDAVNVIITDVTGKEILRKNNAKEVDLSPFADGIYMFRILDKDNYPVMNQKVNKLSSQ